MVKLLTGNSYSGVWSQGTGHIKYRRTNDSYRGELRGLLPDCNGLFRTFNFEDSICEFVLGIPFTGSGTFTDIILFL